MQNTAYFDGTKFYCSLWKIGQENAFKIQKYEEKKIHSGNCIN